MDKVRITLPEEHTPCVVIEAPTGVIYTTQAGGTACGQPEAEGYLVPLYYFDWEELFRIFQDQWECAEHRVPQSMMDQLGKDELDYADAVLFGNKEELDGARDGELKPIEAKLDRERLPWGESWLPITCTYGTGWLTWPNSD